MLQIIKDTISEFLEDKCTRIAAALAYYTAFALAPMLVLIMSVAQLAFEPEDVRGTVRSEIQSIVGEEGAEQIETMLESKLANDKQGWLATLAGGIALLVGATGLFAQLQVAMNDVWQVRPDPESGGIWNFLTKRLVSLGMLLTMAFLVMVSITASSLVHTFDDSINDWLPGQSGSVLISLVDYGLTLGILTIIFAAMFRYLPDARIKWSHVWLAAVVTAVMFLIGKFGIAMYVGKAGTSGVFGAAGSLIIILMWVYYSSIIFLFGAEFAQVWARSQGERIVPDQGAVRVVTSTKMLDKQEKPVSESSTR